MDTRRVLYGTHRASMNKAAASSISTTTTSITFAYPFNFGAGSHIEIDDELMYVYETNATQGSATVERGVLGTTPVQHAASSIVWVEPRFPRQTIKDALQADIRSWPTSVYKVTTLDGLVASASDRVIDLTGIPPDFYDILEVRRAPITNQAIVGNNAWPEVRDYDIVRDADSTLAASGVALQMPYVLGQGVQVRVTYSRPFDTATFTDATTLEGTIGLEERIWDIPVLGACWRLLHGREIKRTFTEGQGEARRGMEVPPRYISATADDYKKRRDSRLEDEARRLANSWPMRGM